MQSWSQLDAEVQNEDMWRRQCKAEASWMLKYKMKTCEEGNAKLKPAGCWSTKWRQICSCVLRTFSGARLNVDSNALQLPKIFFPSHLLQSIIKPKPTNFPTHIQPLHQDLHSWCQVANICKQPQQYRVNYWKIFDVPSHLFKSYLWCSPPGNFPLTAEDGTAVSNFITWSHE